MSTAPKKTGWGIGQRSKKQREERNRNSRTIQLKRSTQRGVCKLFSFDATGFTLNFSDDKGAST